MAEIRALSLRQQKIDGRNAILDNVRGLFVLLFVLVHVFQYLPRTFSIPAWFEHSEYAADVSIKWWGFNLIDLAPIGFVFFVGLIIYPAFEKRRLIYGKAAYKDYFIKNLALNGLFLILVVIKNRALAALGNADVESWTFMNGVATTCLLMLPFLTSPFRRSAVAKFIAAAIVFTVYIFSREFLQKYAGTAKSSEGGGVAACVGFLGVVLLTSGIADIAKKGMFYYFLATAVLYLIGLLFTRVLMYAYPLERLADGKSSYEVFSAGYMIGALSKVNVIYFILYSVNHLVFKDKAIPLLATMGRNLLLYVLFMLLVMTIEVLFPIKEMDVAAAFTVTGLCGVLCFIISIPLSKGKVLFKL